LWEADAWRAIRDETAQFLQTLSSPCGLFVVDDVLAAVVLRAAEEIGRTVPDTLLVVSYGDDPLYCFSQVPP
jgi:DNA-binding LacI/PurR family transcriptional regulator